MFNPKVSIIIPVYNGSNYLAEAINSALNQTYENIEVLVVNDGSTDNGATEKVALSFGEKIIYIKKENGGVSTALNLGIEKMTGEYFSWLSHDDLYYPNKIEEQINELKKLHDKNIILSCDFEYIDENGNNIGGSNIKKSDYDNILYSIFIRKYSIYGCALLIPKKILNTIGYFDTKMKCTQDYDYWLRMLGKGYKFEYIDKILTKYRRHSEQGTNQNGELYNKCVKEEFTLYGKYLFRIGLFKIIKKSQDNIIKSILKVIVPLFYNLVYIIIRKIKSIK